MSAMTIDFRSSSGYVTDPAGAAFCGGDAYPVTRNGWTFGWIGGASANDRSTTVDPRLAGINYGSSVFQFDLPAPGTYTIGIAAGDASDTSGTQTTAILDNGTTIHSITVAAPSGAFADANGSTWTAANFYASQTFKTLTFSSTKFQLVMSVGNYPRIASLSIEASAGDPGAGSSAGVASVVGVGQSIATATGVIAGSSSASGLGASRAAAAGTIAGTSAADAGSGTSESGAGTIAGASTVSAEGGARVRAAGDMVGQASVAGEGRSVVTATGVISGSSSTAASGGSTAAAAGSLAGTSDAQAYSPPKVGTNENPLPNIPIGFPVGPA